MPSIVVIEDTAAVRKEVAEILRFEGFDVRACADGRSGIATIEERRPDVVICDVKMPGLDGYETLAELRKDERFATLPFVFLTARTDRTSLRRGMELGADDYLTKPFSVDELLAAVQAALAKRERVEEETDSRLRGLRDQILISLPHELRTPLNIVAGYAEVLAEGAHELGPEDIEQFARNIVTGARQLNRLTENLLLATQLDLWESWNERPVVDEPIFVDDVASKAATTAAQKAKRDADLSFQVEPVAAAIDVASARKIVEELVDNACKFSDAGSPVVLTVEPYEDGARIVVKDEGIGMSAAEVERIDACVQFDRVRREQQGMGLGLHLASRLALLYGGSLQLASAVDRGTTVTVTLPGVRPGQQGRATATGPLARD